MFRNTIVFIFFFLLVSKNVSGQKRTFNLSDTSFTADARYTSWQIQYADNNSGVYSSSSTIFIDSLVWFMNKNKSLVIEIQDHRNPNPYSSGHPSMDAARNIVDSLVKKGISPNRLIARAYAATQPIISDDVIKKTPEAERKKLQAKNCRTTLVIKSVK